MNGDSQFPETVGYKSCTARIYRLKNRKMIRFEVRYHDLDLSLQRLTFPTYATAKKMADTVVKMLAENREGFVTLRGREAYEYRAATEMLAPFGQSLLQATTAMTESLRLLNGATSVQEAVKYFVTNRPQKSPDIRVHEVVDELLALKAKEGNVGKLYQRDLRLRLKKFADSFNCPISTVIPSAIRDFLLNMNVENRTRHNWRTTITTLMNFAKGEGYLAADFKGVPAPTKRTRMKLAIKIFTPEEIIKLLDGARPDQIVPIAVMGFAGIRAEECKRLCWEHLDFAEKHIIVPDSVAKCEERRIVPMSDNLYAWLLPHKKDSGPLCPFTNLANVFAHRAKRVGVEWKRNGLRHGFISCRVALIKNVPQVAFEAGNSVSMVYRHYLKVVSESTARQWFGIFPNHFTNVIPIPTSKDTPIETPRPIG